MKSSRPSRPDRGAAAPAKRGSRPRAGESARPARDAWPSRSAAPASGRVSAGAPKKAAPKRAPARPERDGSAQGSARFLFKTGGPKPKSTRAVPGGGPRAAAAEPPALLPSQAQHVQVGPHDEGQRLDNFLLKRLPGVPKSHVYRLLRSGQVRVDGGRVKPERKLHEGEDVRIPPVRVAEKSEAVRAPDAVLNRLREAIVHEDADYLAICKPAGLASHGGTGIAYGVIEAARGWGKYDFLELAHRLDRDTSGVLLMAKSRPALLRAQKAFKNGLAKKRYFALLVGRLQGGARDVDAALVKSRLEGGERYVQIDEEDGKPSKSRFTPQQHYKDATLCEVEIFSGRTHQIRVHALALGHPVAGDRKYGLREEQKTLRDKGLRRMFLHSHFLELPSDGEFGKLLVNAPITEELRDFMGLLGGGK